MNSHKAPEFSVLHVATAFSWRGGEQQVAYLTSELKRLGIRQYILCAAGSAMEEYCIASHIPFFTSPKRSSFDISFAQKIKKLCAGNSIQLVHAHDSHAHTFAIYAAVLFGNKAKIIVSRRVDFKVSKNILSKFKYNHSAVARILCVSDKIREITSEAVNDQAKLVTVHSGIDASRFTGKVNTGILHREFSLAPGTKIVANVAALAPHKDYPTFLRTVAILKKKFTDVAFFIIGDGPEKEKIDNMINEMKLNDVVYCTGFRTDIPDILPELDVMLITSETEGLGTAILDAFACKVPVVATAAGGIPEIVIHQQTGLLAAVADASGLADAVTDVLTDVNLRNSLIAGATAHLQNFSREATAAKTLREYLAVTGSQL
ncbi:MAG: glycosyltransferase family 4 protein [Bacteroidetes bacterium]|nr:glycosyltransferase family 4 protein [Bacteroidota bacterium]